jgi:hypothetical protein
MYVDPQGDAASLIVARSSEANDVNRSSWEHQERVRQHLLSVNAEQIPTTASVMKKPPQAFPFHIPDDLEERIPNLVDVPPEAQTVLPRGQDKNIEEEQHEQSNFSQKRGCQVG